MNWIAYAAFGWRKSEVLQEIAVQTALGWIYQNKLYVRHTYV